MDSWNELQQESGTVLLELLKTENPSRSDFTKGKIAASVMASVTRHEATESSKERTAVVAARMLTSNEQEFKAYIAATAPRLQPKQLEAAKTIIAELTKV